MAGETEPAALRVADTEPLDRWGLLLGLVAHGRTLPAGAVRSVREDVAVIAPDQTLPHTDTRAERILVVVGIVVLAFNLRPAAVSVGPVLDEITTGLGMSGTTAGVLTTLPVLSFAGFGALAPWLARVLGLHRITLVALVSVVVGLGLRSQTSSKALISQPVGSLPV